MKSKNILFHKASRFLIALSLMSFVLFFLPLSSSAKLISLHDGPNSSAVNLPTSSGYSENWAGYISSGTGNTYTGVSGTWIIPNPTSSGGLSADATWIGIGGVKSTDLIQVGTQNILDFNGQNVYEAWYELLPSGDTMIPVAIKPGDVVNASVSSLGNNLWSISFVNETTGKNYSATVTYNSSLSSAEWIQEMPTDGETNSFIPLDNFSTVPFIGGRATVNGSSKTIAGIDANPMTMLDSNNQIIASTSPLGSDGSSFAVTRTAATQVETNVPTVTYTLRVFRRGGDGARNYRRGGSNAFTTSSNYFVNFPNGFNLVEFQFGKLFRFLK